MQQHQQPQRQQLFRDGFNVYSENTYFFTEYWKMVVAPYGKNGDICGVLAPWNMVLLTITSAPEGFLTDQNDGKKYVPIKREVNLEPKDKHYIDIEARATKTKVIKQPKTKTKIRFTQSSSASTSSTNGTRSHATRE
ncbi:uncharacterized protein L201_001322 [Kwoniella dendrophila CBS 6074]|uniref:Uncharacterized protein n=1 Tax=Kwoniella dendrophila CBS 6074 TaxID=1295534 RepID=A0AAX4JPG2_9TREE